MVVQALIPQKLRRIVSSRLAWDAYRDPVSNNQNRKKNKKIELAGHQWLTPVILVTLEAKIRRIMI
jgi:hypothetical protein